MKAFVRSIACHLPERTLTNEQLVADFPDWDVEKIAEKTGIHSRRLASEGECASDLAAAAALRLFESGACQPKDIDFVLFCTQSPDYFLPTTACLLQDRLGVPRHAGALDFNLGCSGFVYGLSLAKGLIETDQAHSVLLLTADTYTKYLSPEDRSVRTLFGDAGGAALIVGEDHAETGIGPFVFGTDGQGGENLIVRQGGARCPAAEEEQDRFLFMNGSEIFNFALVTVPQSVNELLQKSGLDLDAIDLFVFHQANRFMLDHLRRRIRIPKEKFWTCLADCGNTVSVSIPLALCDALERGALCPGATVLLVGFGVGYSWTAGLIRWPVADPVANTVP